MPGVHAQEVAAERVFVGRNMRTDVTVDNVLALLVPLHHVQHTVSVAEEHLSALLALETQLLF